MTSNPPPLNVDLEELLTRPEVSSDYKCSEVFTLTNLTQTSANVKMTSQEDTAQMLQFRAEPLNNLGDCFSVVVADFGKEI